MPRCSLRCTATIFFDHFREGQVGYRLLVGFCIITGSIARSATRRYLSYSDADFEVFRPAGATRTDAGEIWRGGGDQRSRPPKLKFVLRFDQNVEYKRPTVSGCVSLKISLDLLEGLWSYGGF